jgi:hypothetical protein
MFLGESTFNLSNSTIEVKTTINKTFEPSTPPTTPDDPTCECLSEEEIIELIKTEIKSIKIPDR